MKAPYRFIPISSWIYQPDWRGEASQDIPYEDGLSGTLDLSIEAVTPLMIGGKRTRQADDSTVIEFFRTPDGREAIPGSTVRGAMRAVMEIATFGRAAFIDRARYGIRDLNAVEIYRARLTTGLGQQHDPVRYRIKSGWLRRDNNDHPFVQPCQWAKVHVDDLQKLSGSKPSVWEPRQSAAQRYVNWGEEPLQRRLYVDPSPRSYPHSDGLWLNYRRAGLSERAQGDQAQRVAKDGTIVMTGKPVTGPSNKPKIKKYEFFFFDPLPNDSGKPVTSIWADFLLIHDPQPGAAGSTGNESWPSRWREVFRRGEPVPVFYIEKETGEIESMGLASMFCLAHRLDTHQLLAHANPGHLDESVLDLPTLLFGAAADTSAEPAAEGANQVSRGRRGRVMFELAPVAGNPARGREVSATLASPKPQFYHAYVRQQANGGPIISYTPTGPARPELSGRKRYPAKPMQTNPVDGEPKMRSILRPVGQSTTFVGRVRFHNLRPAELGALVWCLRLWAPSWGKPPASLLHTIGMGKPLGMGSVRLRVGDACIEPNQLRDCQRVFLGGAEAAHELDRCTDLFAENMEQAYRSEARRYRPDTNSTWRGSEQIETLLGLARPAPHEEASSLSYMTIAEFQDAKKAAQRPPYPRLPHPPRLAVGISASVGSTEEAVFPRPRVAVPAASRPSAPSPASARPAARPAGPTRLSIGDRAIDLENSDDSAVVVVEIVEVLSGRTTRYRVRDEDGDIRICTEGALRLHR